MFTSLNIQGFTNFRENFIFISKERMQRVNFSSKNITQEAIDKAFQINQEKLKLIILYIIIIL